jgi:predicted GTPase
LSFAESDETMRTLQEKTQEFAEKIEKVEKENRELKERLAIFLSDVPNFSRNRNVLIIGDTGSGRSALANVLSNTNKFRESEYSVSETKKIQIEDFFGLDGMKYRVIDTPSIGSTGLTDQEVLEKMSEMIHSIRDGLNQLLFVINGRLTKEEILAFDLLKEIIFDESIIKYTTIVRTRFSAFLIPQKCKEDRQEIVQSGGFAKVSRIVHVDNPPVSND